MHGGRMTVTSDAVPDAEIDTDVAIVGAGPVGLFAAFECGMLKLSSVLIDALGEVGGQCTALYPEKPIYDIPAHPAIEAGRADRAAGAQIAPFAVPRLLGRRVERLDGAAGGFTLATDRGDAVRAKAVHRSPPAPARSGRTGRRWTGWRPTRRPARCTTTCGGARICAASGW